MAAPDAYLAIFFVLSVALDGQAELPQANPDKVGEFGWGGAASTHFWISPHDDLAVVVLTQLMPFTFQMELAVKPLVYDALQIPPDGTTSKPGAN